RQTGAWRRELTFAAGWNGSSSGRVTDSWLAFPILGSSQSFSPEGHGVPGEGMPDREGLATQQGGHSTGWFDDSIIIDPLRALRDSVVKLGLYGITGSTMCDGLCALQ